MANSTAAATYITQASRYRKCSDTQNPFLVLTLKYASNTIAMTIRVALKVCSVRQKVCSGSIANACSDWLMNQFDACWKRCSSLQYALFGFPASASETGI